jgi:competence protein ComFC
MQEIAELMRQRTDASNFALQGVLTAVPLNSWKKRWRGFNQAELLARELARLSDRPYVELLVRKVKTASQVRKGRTERLANLKGAFAVVPFSPCAPVVTLVDDVMTTGSTLEECARTLKAAGAKTVYAIVFARGS